MYILIYFKCLYKCNFVSTTKRCNRTCTARVAGEYSTAELFNLPDYVIAWVMSVMTYRWRKLTSRKRRVCRNAENGENGECVETRANGENGEYVEMRQMEQTASV